MRCRTQPEFYNTLTTNCTTNIWTNNHVNAGRVPLSWKILASGYVPEYLYEQGRLETMGLSFPELQNGPTSTRAPRRLMGRRTSRDEFALGAKRGPTMARRSRSHAELSIGPRWPR